LDERWGFDRAFVGFAVVVEDDDAVALGCDAVVFDGLEDDWRWLDGRYWL
jgi:hypothetical protein